MEDTYKPSEEEIKEDREQLKNAHLALVCLKDKIDPDDIDTQEKYILDFLKCFHYNKEIEIYKFDAMLIKAAKKMLSKDSAQGRAFDIVLMSLGLLEGYYYKKTPKVNDRRWAYICATKYRKNENVPYDAEDRQIQKKYTERLRKNEEEKSAECFIKFLFVESVGKIIESLNSDGLDYDEKNKRAILPLPHYLEDIATKEFPSDDPAEDFLREASSVESVDDGEDDEIKIEKDSEQEEQYTQEKINNGKTPPTEDKVLWKRLSLVLGIIIVVLVVGGIGMYIGGWSAESKSNTEVSNQVASENSDKKSSIVATSIEVENKNIYLAPGGYEYLVVKATPPEVDILFDLNYISKPKGIVTIDKNRDDTYVRVTALHLREEDMCDKVTIIIQGSGTAEAEAYVFIKNTDSKGISAGNNIDSD